MVKEAGLADQLEIDSAGTAAYHAGERADQRSRAFAARRGYDLRSVARQFVAGDFERFDYVLAMDQNNLDDLLALRRETRAQETGQLSLFRAFDRLAPRGASVPDPYYGGDRGFEEVLDQCERACEGLIEHLLAHELKF